MTTNVYFQDLDKYGILASSEPFETADFDVRGQFNIIHTEATSSNTVCFGVFGLASETNGVVDQCIALRVYRGGSNNVRLEKIRGDFDTPTNLATASFTIANNMDYWVRLVCQGGRFRAYLSTTRIWGSPVIDYTWGQTDYPVMKGYVSPGKGQCGVFSKIMPLRFGTTAIDSYSACLPVSSSASLQNFAGWPSAGKLFLDGEYMIYGAKSPGTTFPTMTILTDPTGNEYWDDSHSLYTISSGNYELAMMTNDLANYANYLIWYQTGNEANAAWKILANSTGSEYGHNIVTLTSIENSGHSNTSSIDDGNPFFHEEAVIQSFNPDVLLSNTRLVAYILPGLLNISRGANGTSGAPHIASTAYLFEGDVINCKNFESYDFAEDYNTERLLRTTCFLAGVESEFITYASGSTALACGTGFANKTFIFNDNYTCLDIQLSASLASGQELGVGFRTSSASQGFVASVSYVGGVYYANLYDSGSVLLEQHRYHQVPTGQLNIRVVSCIKVAGDIGTFVAISLNGMVHTCHSELYPPKSLLLPLNAYIAANGTGTVTATYSIPEFGDWREAVYLNPNSDAQSDLSQVVADRFVKIVSRSGEKLKFSAWDNYGTAVQAMGALVVDDQTSQEDAEFFSYMHLEADNIHEVLDADLVANEGFRVKAFQTPLLIDDQARASANRQLRYAHEMTDIKTLVIPADLRLENEDKITVGYITEGSRLVRANASYVISDLQFSFESAKLDLQIGVRKWVDDTIR